MKIRSKITKKTDLLTIKLIFCLSIIEKGENNFDIKFKMLY